MPGACADFANTRCGSRKFNSQRGNAEWSISCEGRGWEKCRFERAPLVRPRFSVLRTTRARHSSTYSTITTMPLNLKISWGSGASSARLLGLDDGTTLAELKGVIASKTGIGIDRCGKVKVWLLSQLRQRLLTVNTSAFEAMRTCHTRMHHTGMVFKGKTRSVCQVSVRMRLVLQAAGRNMVCADAVEQTVCSFPNHRLGFKFQELHRE